MSAVIRTTRKSDDPASSPGYDTDFSVWAFAEAEKLRRLAASGGAGDLDVDNIIEELETLGRRDRHEIGGRLSVLLAHLLKCHFQADKLSKSWQATISEQRLRIKDLLEESPSLNAFLVERLKTGKDYTVARKQAAAETGLPESTFPAVSPFTIDDILDDGFFGQSSNE